MQILLQRLLFRLTFCFNRKAIARQCLRSPEYYHYTCELIRSLYDGEAQRQHFANLHQLMWRA